MLRRSLLVPLIGVLLLSGCSGDPVVPAADPAPLEQLAPACPAVAQRPVVTPAEVNQVVADATLPGWQAGEIGRAHV